MRLVVGLGNPGNLYVGTRHNIGWEVLDDLARGLGLIVTAQDFNESFKGKFEGLALDGIVSVSDSVTEKILLLKPTTFMNRSGKSVAAAAGFYKIPPQDILVVLDDLALPCGRLRIRSGGSSGGHNGLKDIERAIGTDQYPRLRLGIDPPPPNIPGADYVLGKFSEEQRPLMDLAVQRAVKAVLTWIKFGLEKAMNDFNADEQ
jgi:peptidyl-tRNA hydrolase, PTH1 family